MRQLSLLITVLAAFSTPVAVQPPGQADHRLDRAATGVTVARSSRTQRPPIVAAASDLSFALTDLVNQFAAQTGERIELVFGSSGTLARQIRDGAPFQIFMSADETFVDELTRAGLTRDPGALYAIGRIVLFAPTGSPLIPAEGLDGLARLLAAGRVTKFAIANPEHAPYGRAAEAALRKRGVWDGLRSRLVLGENVSQAAQFATTGNAVGGIVAYSVALSPHLQRRGSHALIPETDHPPLRQRMVLLNTATTAAARFYEYLQQGTARATFERHGFRLSR